MWAEWRARAALVLVQLNYGGYHVLTKVALSSGINQLVFCAYRDVIAWCILVPFAYFKEKRSRPPLTKSLLLSFFVLGSTGIFANQLLFCIGLSLTSATDAAALQPAVPVFTSILAVLMGTESLNLHRRDGKAKAVGVVVAVTGAMVMVFYRGPPIIGDGFDSTFIGAIGGKPSPEPVGLLGSAMLALGLDTYRMGIMCLIGNCIMMSIYFAYQAPLLAKYPHGASVTAFSYTFGALLMVSTLLITTPDFFASVTLTGPEIYAVIYAGVVASAVNYLLMTYSNSVLGPSLVALTYPLQPLATTFLSCVFLGWSVYLSSLIGGCLIVAGLYIVTWSKKETERLGPAYRRGMPFAEALRSDSKGIKVPLLKVLGQRLGSHHTGPRPSYSLPHVG